MNIQVNFELSDKDIEYLLYIEDYLCKYSWFIIDLDKVESLGFGKSHDMFKERLIMTYDETFEIYYPTYLFDEILKQISK